MSSYINIILFLLVLATFPVCSGVSCDKEDIFYKDVVRKPDQEQIWVDHLNKSFYNVGFSGDVIYGSSPKVRPKVGYKLGNNPTQAESDKWVKNETARLSVNSPFIIPIYKWDNNDLVKYKTLETEKHLFPSQVGFIGSAYYYVSPTGDYTIECRELESSKMVKTWPLGGKSWFCDYMRASRNGKYVAMGFEENGYLSPGYDSNKRRYRLAVIGPEPNQWQWFPMLKRDDYYGGGVLNIAVSDDGKYVAVAGFGYGVWLTDGNKLLWHNDTDKMITDVVFSADGKTVYGSGTMAYLYGYDTITGAIKSKWSASPTGESMYGLRVVAVGASPDGRFVAAGMGVVGLVYVWWADSGKIARKVDNGGATDELKIMFSPDSKAMATYNFGRLKIWNMPEKEETVVDPPATEKKKK